MSLRRLHPAGSWTRLGTGDHTLPSSFRAVESKPSQLIGMDEALKPTGKNGFSIIDVTPEKMTYQLFTWRPPQPVGGN